MGCKWSGVGAPESGRELLKGKDERWDCTLLK